MAGFSLILKTNVFSNHWLTFPYPSAKPVQSQAAPD